MLHRHAKTALPHVDFCTFYAQERKEGIFLRHFPPHLFGGSNLKLRKMQICKPKTSATKADTVNNHSGVKKRTLGWGAKITKTIDERAGKTDRTKERKKQNKRKPSIHEQARTGVCEYSVFQFQLGLKRRADERRFFSEDCRNYRFSSRNGNYR